MVLLLLEALGAGLILVGIVWWTMFSGRKGGEISNVAEKAHIPAKTSESNPDLQSVQKDILPK